MKTERFTCRNGNSTIRGLVYKPEMEGAFPAIILSHGFSTDIGETAGYAKAAAENGYLAVCFTFCGGSLRSYGNMGEPYSDGESTTMSVRTEMGDLKAVMDAVKARPDVLPEELVLAGCSQGGLITACVAAERADDIRKVILFYPGFSIPSLIRQGTMLGASFDPENIPDEIDVMGMRLSGQYMKDAMELADWQSLCTYPGPVLILHGTADPIIEYRFAQMAEKTYPNARLVSVIGAGHGFDGDGMTKAVEAMLSFLKDDAMKSYSVEPVQEEQTIDCSFEEFQEGLKARGMDLPLEMQQAAYLQLGGKL